MAINVFRPKYDIDECLAQIRECLEIGWTGIGYKTEEFEKQWLGYTGLQNAYFVNSSTAGLNLAVNILKEENVWKDGDEVITTPITFVSTNHAILRSNLHPVFADIDDTLCLNPKSVLEHITDKTKAVMYVGLGGNTGNYNEIVKICNDHNLKLILDAAHMSGTRLNGVIPGNEADAVVYSFQAVKNLPTADSGMLCFKEKKLDSIAREKGWLGINKDTYTRSTHEDGHYKWQYDVEYLGNKYHGNSIMAAIAIAQLKHLDSDNAYRARIADWYREFLADSTDFIKFVRIEDGCQSSYHLFQILVNDRNGLVKYLNANDIFPGVHYAINTNYPMYSYGKNTCEYAEYVSDHVISLPMHMMLTRKDIFNISQYINKYLQQK